MDNLALKITEEATEQQGFIVDDDKKAEWCLKRVAEERAETQRYVNICESMILEYQQKIEKAQAQLEGKTGYWIGQLQTYFEGVEHKKTKTQETYKLPSGTLKKKYGTPEFVRDDVKFIEWLKSNGYSDKVKVKESPDWAEFKKGIAVDTDKVITADGEIVDGVSVQWNPEKFEVEL